ATSAEKDEDRRHWAFRPLAPMSVPQVADRDRVRNEIDAFVAQALELRELTPAADADRNALARRVFFDLIGLPPSPNELRAFLQDASPQAYERLLDALLESPHFGERWGRHWLDNAGYVDVQGLDNDAEIISTAENKWLFRDYVIASFNDDKPFDRFLLEQLAGDECVDWRNADQYTPEIQQLLVATGFLRNSPDDTSSIELNRSDVHQGILERTQEVVANNLLGLTMQCAKCHDHKYEQLLQADYYRWQALFQPAFNPDSWLRPASRQIPDVSLAEKKRIEDHNSRLDQQIAGRRGRIAELRKPYEQRLLDLRLAQLPESIRADVLTAVRTPAVDRNEIQKYLAGKFDEFMKIKPEELAAILPQADKDATSDLEKQIASLDGQKRTFQHWQAVYDVGPPTPTRLLDRGDYLTPGDEVAPGLPAVLVGDAAAGDGIAAQFGSSGRRLALAKWLTHPNTPAGSLVVRVRVNRIWLHLFGRGIVETTDNFGVAGAKPSHPELLEWLSAAFVGDGQRLKPFLKRIMSSTTYRQTSVRNDDRSETIDPGNKLLWKQRMRRLESEAVRDAILAASGKLDRSMGGSPIPVVPRPDGSFVVKTDGLASPTAQYRRTIYLLSRRNYHPTLLNVFDQPNLATNCSERSTSAVVLQSLTMLNDAFVLEQAAALAERVMAERVPAEQVQPQQIQAEQVQADQVQADQVQAEQVQAKVQTRDRWLSAAFELTLGRTPSEREARWCVAALNREVEYDRQADPRYNVTESEKRALARICHTLLNTSEFLVVP
ncbi:MAG TPA: DUF1549 and DUF1553 domain-containing protein, partial [Pirellulales bacterium]|nr:DUF1549 and DUF1553 domain-containing protein [Pirellulales bacterium]